jgi:glycosyltransferase involved in cell wall biosynthesis
MPIFKRARRLEKVIFVAYGALDSNSGGHIAGFARELGRRGVATTVAARDAILHAHAYGPPAFEAFSHDALIADPEGVVGFDGVLSPARTLVMAWTPRKPVRRAVERIVRRLKIPYVVHFEDNEDHLAALRLAEDPAALATDATERASFLAQALGATVIEPRLLEVLPAGLPALVLEPGADFAELSEPLRARRRAALLTACGAPADAAVIVYPGNAHRANVEEMSALYGAVRRLRARDRNIVLIRTGKDDAPLPLHGDLSEHGVIPLGLVDRPTLVELLKCADLFVQPGAPGPFNDYRLPSKIPEFMAVGRPIILPRTNVGLRLRHGVDAMLLKNGSAEEIVGLAELVLDDAALAQRLSLNAQAFTRRTYNWRRQGGKLVRFLKRLRQAGA